MIQLRALVSPKNREADVVATKKASVRLHYISQGSVVPFKPPAVAQNPKHKLVKEKYETKRPFHCRNTQAVLGGGG